MEHNKEIYIIDSQDALYGNISYDLASLIDDVRFRTSNKDKEIIFQKFMKVNKYKYKIIQMMIIMAFIKQNLFIGDIGLQIRI